MRFHCVVLLSASVGLHCATSPENVGVDPNLPNAMVGPFREIKVDELRNARVAPFAMDDANHFARDVSVLDLDGDASTFDVAGYFAANVEDSPKHGAHPTAIVRYLASDGRSFDRNSQTVLTPDAAWEGGSVGARAALRVGG